MRHNSWFRPIDSLFKIIIWVFIWIIGDAVGNAVTVLLVNAIKGMPEYTEFEGVSALKIMLLIFVNGFAVFAIITDLLEFINYVRFNNFRLF
jgi:hypothetical protein